MSICQNPECGKEFIPSRKGVIYCCRSCRYKANTLKNKEKQKIRSKKWRLNNKDKSKVHAKKWRLNNPDKQEEKIKRRRYAKYGITEIDARILLAKQDFKCQYCFLPLTLEESHIDHCHDTNKVRGILHSTCNKKLGTIEQFYKLPINQANSIIKYANQHITINHLIEKGELEIKLNQPCHLQ